MASKIFIGITIAILAGCIKQNGSRQNPSPMQDFIRPHERVDGTACPGIRMKTKDVFDVPIDVFIPDHLTKEDTADLVIHFHGSPKVVELAACSTKRMLVLITLNFGSGSSKYEKPLQKVGIFDELVKSVENSLTEYKVNIDNIILSGFSAGYGAIRAILTNKRNCAQVAGVLLLDGLHTDYVPEGLVLSKGGSLNASKLEPFLDFAKLAADGKKKFLFTHSSIFPGTFASTTECADYLVQALELSRAPTLKQGPLGMQQVGITEKGGLKILAFAGNTAPDHIDHLHGLYYFLEILLK